MVPAAALALIDDPEQLAAMRARAVEVGRPRAALDIAETILAEIGV